MLHKKTPTDIGWYWIELYDDWVMAYFDPERDDPILTVCEVSRSVPVPETATPEDVTRWVGPLDCPGGDFASNIVEFSVELQEAAEAKGKSPMLCHIEEQGSSQTMTCTMHADEFLNRMANLTK